MDTGINIVRNSKGLFYTKNDLKKMRQISLPYNGNSNDDIFFDNKEIIAFIVSIYQQSPNEFPHISINRVYFNKNNTMIIVPNVTG